MNCHSVMRMLTEYLDDQLAAQERAAVAAHLKACSACCAEEAALRRAEEALTALAAVESAPDLTADLHRRIAAPARRPMRWAWVGAALVAFALLVVLSTKMRQGLPSRSIARAPADTTSPKHPVTSAPAPKAIAERPPLVAPPASKTAPRRALEGGAIRTRHAHRRGPRSRYARVNVAGIPRDANPPVEVRATLPRFSSYHVEVTLPDGSKSVLQQDVRRDATGRPYAVRLVCENNVPEPPKPNQGG